MNLIFNGVILMLLILKTLFYFLLGKVI